MCFQAYSSLGKGELVTDPRVMEVAKYCGRTPAQVCRMNQAPFGANLTYSLFNKCTFLHKYFEHLKAVVHLQVLLRWAVQQGVPVLPKSSNPDRIKDNARIFDFTLNDTDMDRLSALDCGHKYCWDSSEVA